MGEVFLLKTAAHVGLGKVGPSNGDKRDRRGRTLWRYIRQLLWLVVADWTRLTLNLAIRQQIQRPLPPGTRGRCNGSPHDNAQKDRQFTQLQFQGTVGIERFGALDHRINQDNPRAEESLVILTRRGSEPKRLVEPQLTPPT